MKRKIYYLPIMLFLFLGACAPLAQVVPDPSETTRPTDVSAQPSPTAKDTPAQVQATPSEVPTPVAVQPGAPEQAAIQALATKYGIPAAEVHLIKSQPMTWLNGCLGIVIPGVLCTKGPVDGFVVTLEVNGKQYEFHTNMDGSSAIEAAQLPATIKLAVYGSNHISSLVESNIPMGLTYNPAFYGFLPAGGAANGTAYVLDFSNGPKAIAINADGINELDFVKNPNYGLAVWPGGEGLQPRLAWGTQLTDASSPSRLEISNADSSQLETLLTNQAGAHPAVQLVAEFWSADGQSLYFSKEPVGIGGYINFAGGSNLYRINIATKEVTTLIEQDLAGGQMVCLDAISGDYRYVADHCVRKSITIRDLMNGSAATSIQPPAEVVDYKFVGSARFSPDGQRVAFAMAKGDQDHEQGWLAISESLNGGSKLIYSGPAGTYFTIHGWLNDQTLLVESHGSTCNPVCNNELWTIQADGSNLTKVADGSFLAILDNR